MPRSQKEAESQALAECSTGDRMAIVLTMDDYGPTHEWCREDAVELLYGPLLKAEVARIVSTVWYVTAGTLAAPMRADAWLPSQGIGS